MKIQRFGARGFARPGRRASVLLKIAVTTALFGVGAFTFNGLFNSNDAASETSTGGDGPGIRWRAQRGDMTLSVLASGELRTEKMTSVSNQITTYQRSEMKITWVIDEGAEVKKGDKLIELDASEIQEKYLEQRLDLADAAEKYQQALDDLAILESQVETEKLAAGNMVKIAELDLKKYKEGDYEQEKRKMESAIQLAQEKLKRAQDRLEWTEKLHEKKYVTENDLQADRIAVLSGEIDLKTARADLELLENFTFEREATNYETELIEARGKLKEVVLTGERDRNKARTTLSTAQERKQLEEETTKNLEEQLRKTVLRAPADGLVVYHKANHWRDESSTLRVGMSVSPRQVLIDLPDFSSWVVEARVHESKIQQIHLDQPAFIMLDAFPDKILTGSLTKVSVLPDSSRWYRDTQEYIVEVLLDQNLPQFKPGMTGKAEIILEELHDVLIVPVPAVHVQKGRTVVMVAGETGVEPREVVVGKNNDRFVEIIDGLTEGEEISLDQPFSGKGGLGSRPAEKASPDQRRSAGEAAKQTGKNRRLKKNGATDGPSKIKQRDMSQNPSGGAASKTTDSDKAG